MHLAIVVAEDSVLSCISLLVQELWEFVKYVLDVVKAFVQQISGLYQRQSALYTNTFHRVLLTVLSPSSSVLAHVKTITHLLRLLMFFIFMCRILLRIWVGFSLF